MCPSLYDHVNDLMKADVCTEVGKDMLPAGVDYIERDLPGVFVKFSDPIELRELANVAFGLGYAVKLQPHDSPDPKKLFVGFIDTDYEGERLMYRKPIECFSKGAEYLISKKNSDVLTILSVYQSKMAKAGRIRSRGNRSLSGPDGI